MFTWFSQASKRIIKFESHLSLYNVKAMLPLSVCILLLWFIHMELLVYRQIKIIMFHQAIVMDSSFSSLDILPCKLFPLEGGNIHELYMQLPLLRIMTHPLILIPSHLAKFLAVQTFANFPKTVKLAIVVTCHLMKDSPYMVLGLFERK